MCTTKSPYLFHKGRIIRPIRGYLESLQFWNGVTPEQQIDHLFDICRSSSYLLFSYSHRSCIVPLLVLIAVILTTSKCISIIDLPPSLLYSINSFIPFYSTSYYFEPIDTFLDVVSVHFSIICNKPSTNGAWKPEQGCPVVWIFTHIGKQQRHYGKKGC